MVMAPLFEFLSLLLCLTIHFDYGFTDVAPFHNDLTYLSGALGPYPRQTFFSNLDVIAPVPNIVVEQQEAAHESKYVTWAAHGDNITTVPQLLDAETLSVIYQGPQYGEDTFGFTVQTCNNTDYLVWWAGTNIDGRAGGNYYIFDSTYHLVWNVSSIDLEYADAHDVFLTPDCHVVFTAYQPKPFELEEWGLNDNSWLLDSYFQEIDLATNELVFQWRASDFVDLSDSLWLPEIEQQGDLKWHGWDYFHINSVEKDFLGNFLVSARHTNSVYYIDGVTGGIIWTLGGLRNDFVDLSNGSATDFSWQHDARWIDESLTSISLFDDRSCGYVQADDPISRGVIITLDFEAMTAELAASYRAPDGIISLRKGGMHLLDNGNVMLGYGSEPAFTEFAPDGDILWDVRFGPIMKDIDRLTADNYRAYKLDWVGEPHWGPSIAPGPSFNATPVTLFGTSYDEVYYDFANDTAYFSWNGATKVAKWLVLAADDPKAVLSIGSILQEQDKTGFETSTHIGGNGPYICAVALDKDDRMLGITPLLHLDSGSTTSIDDGAGSLYSQFQTFKQKWESRHHKSTGTWLTIVCFVVAVTMTVFGIVAWCRCDELVRTVSSIVRRRNYQPLDAGEKGGSPSPSLMKLKRVVSLTSGRDPITPTRRFFSTEVEVAPWEGEALESETGLLRPGEAV